MFKIHKNIVFFSFFLTLNTIASQKTNQSIYREREVLIDKLKSLETELNNCIQQKTAISNSITQSKEELQNKPLSTYIKETFKKVYGPIEFISAKGVPIPMMTIGFNIGAIIIKAATYILFPITIPLTTIYGIKQWRDAKNEDTVLNMGQIPDYRTNLTWQEKCIEKNLNDINSVKNKLNEIDAQISKSAQ